jgi:hypothetical protein
MLEVPRGTHRKNSKFSLKIVFLDTQFYHSFALTTKIGPDILYETHPKTLVRMLETKKHMFFQCKRHIIPRMEIEEPIQKSRARKNAYSSALNTESAKATNSSRVFRELH